jgi:hypothetical protein
LKSSPCPAIEAAQDELVDPDNGGVDLEVEAVDLNAGGATERLRRRWDGEDGRFGGAMERARGARIGLGVGSGMDRVWRL